MYGVPETFVIDKSGVIRYKQIGPVERRRLVESLESEGREKGDRFRANLDFARSSETRAKEMAVELDALRTLEKTEFQAQTRICPSLKPRRWSQAWK